MELSLILEDLSFTLYAMYGGSHNVEAFLAELERENAPAHSQIMQRLRHLAKYGSVKQNATFKPLREGVFETRAKLGPRILFFYDANTSSSVFAASRKAVRKRRKRWLNSR